MCKICVFLRKYTRMPYTHIVFDIDGTLIDTENAVLSSLEDTLAELGHPCPGRDDLKFALGIPGETTLAQLGIADTAAANRIWNGHVKKYFSSVTVFRGIRSLLEELRAEGYRLGIITSKNHDEYAADFVPSGLAGYFDTVICVDDCLRPKPAADPVAAYLERTGIRPAQMLYIGDTVYDAECTGNAGVDFGLALWGCRSVRHIRAAGYFTTPYEVGYFLKKRGDAPARMPWLRWAMELQFIAQAGITYSKDPFDSERFERIREISAELMCLKTGFSPEEVKTVFCNETGFQTPKIDTRAAVFNDGKLLLVKEKNGTWALPGGWVDVTDSVKASAVKEVKEEAGLDVVAVRLIAVHDRLYHNLPVYSYGVCKFFFLCEVTGGAFEPNIETVGSGYFAFDELPVLAEEKNTRAQIRMCFDAYAAGEAWQPVVD